MRFESVPLDPTVQDSPEVRASFLQWAAENTRRNGMIQFWGVMAGTLGFWPTDWLFFDDPRQLTAFAGWRLALSLVVGLAIAWVRSPVGQRASPWFWVVPFVAGGTVMGAFLGRAGGPEAPWFHTVYLAPLLTVVLVVPLRLRVVLNYSASVAFVAAWFAATPQAAHYPFIGPALTIAAFAAASSAAVGHIIYALAHRTFVQSLQLEAQAKTLSTQARDLDEARARSERLLANILPEPVAARLKEKESAIAEGFPEVSVLFADLAGFTSFSDRRPPSEVVSLLDRLFREFDVLVDWAGLEKIKTIGDAYMVAGNLPLRRERHLEAMANLAVQMLERAQTYELGPGEPLRLRIGIHVGPVVAGVIGKRKLVYDLWGDTVNTASRMESNGVPGRILCTDAVAKALAATHRFEDRGEIEVKGKGLMRTWWLVGRVETPPALVRSERAEV